MTADRRPRGERQANWPYGAERRSMTSGNGLMDVLPQHQKLHGFREVREADLASFDVLPVCVYFISYRGCPRYIWANKQCLLVLDKTLEQLVETVLPSSTPLNLTAASCAPFRVIGENLHAGYLRRTSHNADVEGASVAAHPPTHLSHQLLFDAAGRSISRSLSCPSPRRPLFLLRM